MLYVSLIPFYMPLFPHYTVCLKPLSYLLPGPQLYCVLSLIGISFQDFAIGCVLIHMCFIGSLFWKINLLFYSPIVTLVP